MMTLREYAEYLKRQEKRKQQTKMLSKYDKLFNEVISGLKQLYNKRKLKQSK